jgi:hypothetical protein
MAMPVWLAEAYCSRYADWRMYRKRTLDAAFGVATVRKNIRLRDRERREWLMPRVVLAAQRLHKETGLPFDEELFRRVSKEFRIGRSVASDIFYAVDNPWRALVKAWLKNPKFKL